MIRKLIALLIFTIVIFTSFGYGWSFDKKHGNIEIGDEPGFTHVKITTIGIASGLVAIPSKNITGGNDKKWRKKDGSFLLQGSGCVVSNNYIITAAHVVHPESVTLVEKPWNYYRKSTIKVISRLILVSNEPTLISLQKGATIYYLDIKNDIAILKFNSDNIFKPVGYKMSNTDYVERSILFDMIKAGDAIAMIVRNRDKDGGWQLGFEIRHGHIISNVVKGVNIEELPWFGMNDFTMDLELYGGDSGSAIFAFRHGIPVIIGIARATNKSDGPIFDKPRSAATRNLRSYAVRIDFVKKVVEAK